MKTKKKNVATILVICGIICFVVGIYSHDKKVKESYAIHCLIFEEELQNLSGEDFEYHKEVRRETADITSADISEFDYSRLKINADGSFDYLASDGFWYNFGKLEERK